MSTNPTNKFQFTTPVGRLVSGDAFEAQTKDQQGNPLKDKQGNPTQKFFIGVAFDKQNPEFGPFYQGLLRQSMQDFPHLFDAATGQPRAQFSMKVIDGDGFDTAGKKWSDREGYAGHWVVRFSSQFAPAVYHKGRYEPEQRVTDPNQLRRGYYVRVSGAALGNGQQQKPGIHVNHNMIAIYGFGQEIISGPNASAAFGDQANAPQYMPQGLSAVPLAGSGPSAMQGMPQQPQGNMPGQSMPGQMGGMPQGLPGGAPAAMGPGGPGYQAMPGQPVMQPGAQPQMPSTPGQMPQSAMPGQPMPSAQPSMPGMQQMPQNSMPGGAMPGQPGLPPQQPTATTPSQPAMPGQPDPSFLHNAMQHQGQPQGPQMGPNANGYTYDQWRQYGYTDDQMRAGGIIL